MNMKIILTNLFILVASLAYGNQLDNKGYITENMPDRSLAQNTYYAQIEQQQKVLKYYSILLTISFIALSISFYKKNKILKKTRMALSQAVSSLQESSYMTEAYIGHYLDLYYSYIIKLNNYRKYVLRRLSAGKCEDFIKTETTILIEANSDDDNVFSDFDNTFLSVYPDFIQSVNKLLSESHQYGLKYNKKKEIHKMNTELRILALLKLGISDSKKIASFLRISIQTVYNCRSKIRTKAINESSFENDIKLIGSFR